MDSPCIKQTVCKVLKIFQHGKYLVTYVLKSIFGLWGNPPTDLVKCNRFTFVLTCYLQIGIGERYAEKNYYSEFIILKIVYFRLIIINVFWNTQDVPDFTRSPSANLNP